jgi:hypothetical protein
MKPALLVSLALTVACTRPAAKPAASDGPAQSLVSFCVQNNVKMMSCLHDDAFWDGFSTLYFAKTGQAVDDAARRHWIGVLKDDLLGLQRANGFEQNCQAALTHNKAPTPRSVATVTAARERPCAEFGTALGYMIFHEGAFHDPKP